MIFIFLNDILSLSSYNKEVIYHSTTIFSRPIHRTVSIVQAGIQSSYSTTAMPTCIAAIQGVNIMGENDIRIPKQKRSIEKKQRIKDAAMKLMSEKGYHTTSSNEIAKEAGVSIGTFYSYYKDKKELYKELVADIYSIVLSPMNPVSNDGNASNNEFGNSSDGHPNNNTVLDTSNLSIEETVYLYISIVFEGHEYQSEFQREIASLSEQSDEFREIEMSNKKHATEMFSSILASYKDELRVRDINTAVYMILTTVEAVVHDTVFHKKGKNKKAVMQELTAMIVNYLFAQKS